MNTLFLVAPAEGSAGSLIIWRQLALGGVLGLPSLSASSQSRTVWSRDEEANINPPDSEHGGMLKHDRRFTGVIIFQIRGTIENK